MQARLPPSGHPDPPLRRAAAVVVRGLLTVALALAPLLPGPVRAQDPPSDLEVEMALVTAPVAYGPGDRLRLRLRIANGSEDTLEKGRIRVGIRDRVLSRSALQESYETAPGFESSALPVDIEETIGPGETREVVVDEPIASFPTLVGAVDGGVFPATLSLQEETGALTFASLTIPLIYHPEPPEKPLNVHVLLALGDTPSRDPSGSFPAATEEGGGLGGAVSENGWLDAYISALEEATERGRRAGPPLRVSIAPTPRLLEELADLADGAPGKEGDDLAPDSPVASAAGRSLERLRALLARDGVNPLLVPYASPDLPTLVGNLSLRHTAEQFSEADDVWERVMQTEPVADWVFPPRGRLDAATLEQLQLLRRARKIVFGDESLIPLGAASGGCPEPFLSFACAVEARTDAGPVQGLVGDRLLERALGRLGAGGTQDRLTIQQIFAETAMVHAELPGTEGRVLQIMIPGRWRPSPRLARTLLTGLSSAPWIRTRSADGALAVGTQVMEREIVDRAPAVAGGPDDTFHAEVERTRSLLDSYASLVPPGSDRLQRLRRNVLVASSDSWLRRMDEGVFYLTASTGEVQDEFDKVGITGASDITLTSKRGPLQVVVTNDMSTSARLALRFVSPDLRFDEERIIDTYEPGSHPLTIEPTATGSGVFQLAVRLETTDGHLVDEKRIVVRSTSFNQVALGLTVGAFAFLVLFYVFKAVRKRAGVDGDAKAGA